jgi:hypothetical protein
MQEVIGALLSVAVGVALSPIPIIATVLILLSASGKNSGLAFLVGRVLGIFIVVGLFALLSDLVAHTSFGPAVSWARIVVGLALMVLAIVRWRGRPGPEEEPELPAWMRSIGSSTPLRSARFAILISVIIPNDLLLGVGAGLTIGSAGLPMGTTATIAVIFAIVASVSVMLPVISFVSSPNKTRTGLISLRDLFVKHNTAILAAVLLLFGANQIGAGIAAL